MLATISGKSYDTPTLSLKDTTLGKYFENAKYVGHGHGTNALVFEVTAKKNITKSDIQNTINNYLVFPENNGGTFANNIGTLNVTVTDYCGNK